MANRLPQVTAEKLSLSNPKVLVLLPGIRAAASEVSWVCSALLGSAYFFPPLGLLSSCTFKKGFKLLWLLFLKKTFYPFQNELRFKRTPQDSLVLIIKVIHPSFLYKDLGNKDTEGNENLS